MEWNIRTLGALALPVWLLLSAQTAQAQPPTESSETADEEATPPPASDQLANRIQDLEARDNAREERLSAALERVAELEQGAAQAEESAAAERAARVAATEAAAEAAEAPEENSGPTLRPLASMVTRFEHREGYTQIGRPGTGCVAFDNDCIRYRARVGVLIPDLNVGDDIVAAIRFLPQVTGNWSFGGTSGGVAHPTVGLYEGSLSLAIDEVVRLDIGRFAMAYGEHVVIGTLGWHPAARSFDGARMRIQPTAGGLWVDAFWTMLTEGGTGDFGNFDRYFYGIYAGLGPALAEGMDLDVYALGLQDNDSVDAMTGAQIPWSLRITLGSRFRYRVEMIDMRLEGGMQVGQMGRPGLDSALILAGHVDAEVGLNLADNLVRVSLEGVFASGDDPTTADTNEAYNHLFPTAHAFLGLADVTGGRSNVGSGVLHLMAKPLPQLTIKLDTHLFMRPEAGGLDNLLGGEGDLNVIWTPGAGFRVRGMYGLFIPNEGFWGAGIDPVHYLEIEVGYTLN